LRVKISSVAENDKASKELVKFISKEWGIKKSDMVLLSGNKSQRKLLYVMAGDDFEDKLFH
jgi:uncharacterized protein YggU (UPF0235/DUF167 family)